MKPKSSSNAQQDLFRANFEQILNLTHPLVVLARQIDWKRFEDALQDCYSEGSGSSRQSVRLMVGLHYLKHVLNESDESLIERWVENPYWQYFCGFETLQHEVPLHPTSMTKWRQRVGAERLTLLLQETIAVAVREQAVPPRELAQVNVDTTVQEKNITPGAWGQIAARVL